MPPSGGWSVMCRIWAELAGAETKMTDISTSACCGGCVVRSEHPGVPGGDGSSMLCGVYASLHTGRLTDGGIKWCSVILGVPSIETSKVEWPEGKQ